MYKRQILSYVRARKNSQKSANVETMYQLVDEKVEALEFIVKNETNYTGITLKDLKVKPNNLIACIVRKRQIIIPNGNDSIEAGDSVIEMCIRDRFRCDQKSRRRKRRKTVHDSVRSSS